MLEFRLRLLELAGILKDRHGVVYCASGVCKHLAVVRSHNDNIIIIIITFIDNYRDQI